MRSEFAASNDIRIERYAARQAARSEAATTTVLILGIDDIPDANRNCRVSLIHQAEIFDAEPYDEALEPRQRYQCYQFGHRAKHCEKGPAMRWLRSHQP